MKKSYLILAVALSAGPLWADHQCISNEAAIIDSEVRCVPEGGINLGINSKEDGMKVACMEDQTVKNLCGPDGQITRLRAYTEWYGKLKKFEDHCSAEGGTFAYQDPNFAEPQNETYCLQAVPEVGSGMFEEPLCNYRSVCPAVTVICEKSCDRRTVARLF